VGCGGDLDPEVPCLTKGCDECAVRVSHRRRPERVEGRERQVERERVWAEKWAEKLVMKEAARRDRAERRAEEMRVKEEARATRGSKGFRYSDAEKDQLVELCYYGKRSFNVACDYYGVSHKAVRRWRKERYGERATGA
jgi:hypothetical protein